MRSVTYIGDGLWLMARLVLLALALPLASFATEKLTISPSNPKQLSHSRLHFIAVLNRQHMSDHVRWSSSDPMVARIGPSGEAMLLSPGTTVITARLTEGERRASTLLTVTTATSPVFSTQPTDTDVSAGIDSSGGIQVKLLDNLGGPLTGQQITIRIGTNPPALGTPFLGTGTLSGTLKQMTNASGIATFTDLKIDWMGTGYTLLATAHPSSGPVSGTSSAFNELRVGDPCFGANPTCSSGCADSDSDGLNDAWEIAGGIDLNGDGKITNSDHDLLLPGTDPNKPDVYVKYDYMVASSTSAIGTPPHSHQPPQKAIDQVVEAFAAHGVTLHIDPQHDAIPEVLVTTLDPNPTVACTGTDFVTMQALRQQHFGNRKWAYHYGIFAHNATLPDTGSNQSCPADRECFGLPDPLGSGVSELPGSNFIVAFGADVDQDFQDDVSRWAGTFMHELGHNFGLKHGSLAGPAPESCRTQKPNYISVMGYSYQNGISMASQPGSATPRSCNGDGDCPSGSRCTDTLGEANVCYRVDYSREMLLDLNEGSLDETVGVAGVATDTDIVTFFADSSIFHAPSFGAIDWNGNGEATEPNVQVDLDNDSGTPNTMLLTANDWEVANGALKYLNFKFQCTSAFAKGSGAPATGDLVESSVTTPEPGHRYAREHHVLYPPAAASVLFEPACSNPGLKPRAAGTVQLALLGSAAFDANQVDLNSLSLHGAHPASITVSDVNNDGIPDLLLEFQGSEVHVSPRATHVRLTGWLKNSRSFVGEARPTITNDMNTQPASCH